MIEDIFEMSDAEVLAEARESGEDTDALAEALRASMREAAAAGLRSKLLDAKKALGFQAAASHRFRPLTIEAIKARVQASFAVDPALGLAFRDVRTQADEDWQSLYDDLVSMGEIDPNADGS